MSSITDFDFSKILIHVMHDDSNTVSLYSSDPEWIKDIKTCEHFTVLNNITSDIDNISSTLYPTVFNVAILCNCSEDFITILQLNS